MISCKTATKILATIFQVMRNDATNIPTKMIQKKETTYRFEQVQKHTGLSKYRIDQWTGKKIMLSL